MGGREDPGRSLSLIFSGIMDPAPFPFLPSFPEEGPMKRPALFLPPAFLVSFLFLGRLPAQGSLLLKDINRGSISSLPARFCDVLGTTFFSAADPVHGHSLWKTDGTPAGTVLVKDFYPGSGGGVQPRELTALEGVLLCIADDSIHGGELWRSDGTPQGTWMVRDINPGNQGRPIYMDPPVNLTYFRGRVYFSARDGIHGRELWSTDGTPAGTALVKDIRPGNNYSDSYPSYLTPAGDKLFFFGYETVHGWELWVTDGTGKGTRLVKDIWPGPEPTLMTHNRYQFNTAVLGGRLIFAVPDGTHGNELWISDGTAAGTKLLKDITPGKADSYIARNFTRAGGVLFFTADDGKSGRELWKTDGTTAGTVLVKDIVPGRAGSNPGWMAAFGNKVVFTADDGIRGYELWVSDGTAAGTKLLKEIKPGPGGSVKYSRFYKLGSRYAWFAADDGVRGAELWRTDGTAAGTVLVKDIWAGSSSSYPEYMTLSGGTIVFRARDGAYGQEPRVIFPGATAQVRGEGYPVGGVTGTLGATDPVLGGTMGVYGQALTAAQPIFLFAGFPGGSTSPAPGFRVYLDLKGRPILLLKYFHPAPSPFWSLKFQVPASAVLAGRGMLLQAFQVMPSAPLGAAPTNAVLATFGN